MSAYFKGGGRVEKTLRFFNLLEPGHMVLSLSKLAMWATGALVTFVLVMLPDQLDAVIGSIASFGCAGGNYAYRRHKQYESGNEPYPPTPKVVDTVSERDQDNALDKL